MNEATRIYNVVTEFAVTEWNVFARTKLKLSNFEIEEAEKNNHGDMKEQRYQMVRKWMRKNGRVASIDKLEELAAGNESNAQQSSATASPSQRPQETLIKHVETTESSAAASQPEKSLRNYNRNDSRVFSTTPEYSRKYGDEPYASGHSTDDTRSIDSGVQSDNKKPKKFTKKLKDLIGWNKSESGKTKGVAKISNSRNACNSVGCVSVVPASTEDYKNSLIDLGIYEISGPRKGLALILNNSFSEDDKKARKGSELDVKHMEELWTQMGCHLHKGRVHREKTASEMRTLLGEVNDVSDYSFLVIVIMSHGGAEYNETFFQGSDGETVTVREVEELFNNSRSKSIHIPKFFIFQFCRGPTVDKGVEVDNFNEADFKRSMKSLVEGSAVETDGGGARSRLPTASKILLAYATMDGHSALRDPDTGSWFINAITNIFMEHACNNHVADLLVKVQENMESKTGTYKDEKGNRYECKAMSKHESSLTKKFFLFPGHPK